MDLTGEDGTLVPTGTCVRFLVGTENKSGYHLAISEHGSIVSLTTSADRGEGHKLAMETIGLAQECDVLFNRVESLQGRLRAHTEFGKEKEWDYASGDENDIRLVKNNSDVDLDIANALCQRESS